MEEIRLWEISKEDKKPVAVSLEVVEQTETESLLEETIVSCPDLLLPDLKLVGRQTDTPGGPLDLLGVDGDGQLVVFELKRGTLTRDAVAQVIDYGSYLAELDLEELSSHISGRSGRLGIEKIESFAAWYQEEFGKSLSGPQVPRLILVGLGADDRARRMVSFLADSEVDISLITFHAFSQGGRTFLARQVEVEAPQAQSTPLYTKAHNLAELQKKVKSLGVDGFYYQIARSIHEALSAYEWPNPGGYSYYLPEQTESGVESNRVYVSLYLQDSHRGQVQIRVQPRAVDVIADFLATPEAKAEHLKMRADGGAEVWVGSLDEWTKKEPFFKNLCSAIVAGWRKKREQQDEEERQLQDTEQAELSDHTT